MPIFKKTGIFLSLTLLVSLFVNVFLFAKLYKLSEQFLIMEGEYNKLKFSHNFSKEDSNDKIKYSNYGMDELEIYLAKMNGNKNKFSIINSDIVNTLNSSNKRKLTSDACYKSHLKISPDNSRLGYFVSLNCLNKFFLDYENHTSLYIISIDGKSNKEIYKGNYHTSNWDWLNNEEVIVYYGCGTECMAGFVIDANTGEQKSQLQYGVNYTWSPDKKYALAYNYSGKYGITVGDKKGNILLSVRREPSDYDLIGETEAIWSPDSAKLAVIIKKEGTGDMELLIFKAPDFGQIFQTDIDFTKDAEFAWEGNKMIIFNNIEILVE